MSTSATSSMDHGNVPVGSPVLVRRSTTHTSRPACQNHAAALGARLGCVKVFPLTL